MERQSGSPFPRLVALALLALLTTLPFAARAETVLVMVEEQGCAWCARWNAEVAPEYPKTAEGRAAPLRRVDLHAPWPEDLAHIRPERMTPTFVLAENGKELGRLRGYPGDEFFWVLLDEMLEKNAVKH